MADLIDDPGTLAGDTDASVIALARPGVWKTPYLLLFQPHRFFTWFADYPIWVLYVVTWLMGMFKVLDRVQADYGLGRSRWPFAHDDWGVLWMLIAAMGVFSGAMMLAIGGWWYKVRVQWSGGEVPSHLLVCKVWAITWLVVCIPALIMLAVETLIWDAPRIAYDAEPIWIAFSVPLLYFWSLYPSYRGARLVFGAKRWPAIGWLVVLPGAVNTIVIVILIGVIIWSSAFIKPDLKNLSTFQSATMRFDYPGNWIIDRSSEDFDEDTSVGIMPRQDAFMGLYLYESLDALAEQLEVSREALGEVSTDWHDQTPVTTWGGREVQGFQARATMEGSTYRITVVCCWVGPGWVLEVRELVLESDVANVQAGFDAVAHSLELSLGDTEMLESPARFESNTMKFEHAATWWVDDERLDHDANAMVTIEAPYDAFTQVYVYESEMTATEELAQSHAAIAELYGQLQEVEPLTSWGSFTGLGFTAKTSAEDGTIYRIRAFVHDADLNMMLEVWEVHLEAQAEMVQPAFKAIENSFELRLQDRPTGAYRTPATDLVMAASKD